MSKKEEYLREWITKAEDDLDVINKLTEEGIVAKSAVCFHCQQLAEKYLKIFLIYKEKEFTKTHNIELLLEECSQIDKDFSTIEPKNLSDFGVNVRYPGDIYIPSDKETMEYKEIALEIRILVRLKI
ncbi:MAG: HEPN domain-containing protein [Bacteroidales bacterium]|jgi:HEPN domain-containing protein